MSEKKGGNQPHNEEIVKTRRLDDAINQCLEDQKTARKLLPGLYKIPELDDRLNKAEDKYHVLLSTLNTELKSIEHGIEARFAEVIKNHQATNQSINELSSKLALMIQRFDTYNKDLERLEKAKDEQVASLRKELFYKGEQISVLQNKVTALAANQGNIKARISSALPTVVSVAAMIGTAYAILAP